MAGEYGSPFLNDELSKRTFIFGLRLWVIVGVCAGAGFVLLLFLLSLYFVSRRSKSLSIGAPAPKSCAFPPIVSKEIQEIKIDAKSRSKSFSPSRILLGSSASQTPSMERLGFLLPSPQIQIEIGKEHRILFPESGSSQASGECRSAEMPLVAVPEVSHLGWGHWYTLRELEAATGGFAADRVIGEGGYGIVYHGVLEDGSQVAVKNLLNNRGQAEKEFKVEVEAIGRIRHKNLVRLLGYCAEGAHRMLVYEFVDNGNLDQWLHGNIGSACPLSWDTRMNIILGTAKGLVYLHEGLEPKIVHRDIKSSNILIDKQWNPRVSDFGLAKMLGSERSYVTTRVMGTFGYVAPEYAKTGMLNEKSDVYSFGILVMEIISGRSPVDYSRPPGEVSLVDWLKTMVTDRNADGILDPRIPDKPPSRALKKALLVALRCVDPDSQKRPKMGHVIHMLEIEDLSYREEMIIQNQ
ncbi:putative serine/threonine-protein kinase At1g01540 isoform X2 [Wolffia australiana]